jgi:hypothetical protein
MKFQEFYLVFFSCTKRENIIDKWKQRLFAQFEDNLDDDNGEELSLLRALASNYIDSY